MPDTLAALLALSPDNTTGDVSPADLRAIIEGLYELDLGTPPVDGDFAWVNQNSSVLTVNSRGHISLIAPHNAAGSLSCRVKTAPATPYTITARYDTTALFKNFVSVGLMFRQTSDGKIVRFGPAANVTNGTAISIEHWTNATTFSASATAFGRAAINTISWWRIADNGTNRIYSASSDGENFVDLYSEGRTTFLTADQVGFVVNAQNGAVPNLSVQMVVKSWDEA